MKGLSLAVLCGLCAFSWSQDRTLTLDEAIRLAGEKSPVLSAMRYDMEAARAGLRAARAQTLPQVSANGFAKTGNNSSILSSSPMVEPAAWMMTPTGNILIGNLMLMVPILAPGLQAMAGAASWEARAAEGEYSEMRAQLALEVTEAYSSVLLAREKIGAAEAEVTANEELVRTTRALFEVGKGIEATVQRTEAELARARRELTSARNDAAKASLDLAAVIGLDLSETIQVTEVPGTTQPHSLDDLLARGKRSRGSLIAARARFEAAARELRAAEGQRLPQLYGVAMADGSSRRDMGGVTAGLTLSFPLFDGGRISAEVAKARSMRSKAEAQVRQTELTVEREIRQARLDVETAQANAASAEASVKAAQSAYEVTALRVSAGKSILVEQLDAMQALTRARADLAEARFEQAVAAARLVRATGGAS